MPDLSDMLPVWQVAAALGVTPVTIYRRIYAGTIPARRTAGGVWLIPRAEVQRWEKRGARLVRKP